MSFQIALKCIIFILLNHLACMTIAQDLIVRTIRSSELRADKLSTSKVVQTLPNQSQLRLLSLEGGWAWVELSTQRSKSSKTTEQQLGWVRASNLDMEANKSNVSLLNTGRQSSGATLNAALTLGVRGISPRINRHALIINISQYAQPSILPLPGTKHDKESAIQMAHAMQVPISNMHFLSDEQATGDGIRKALKDLNDRVEVGDRVFVYYSGHGTRYFDKEAEGCVEALMTYDGTYEGMVSNRELAQLLKPVTDKTDKLFVMYDACHSGGLLAADSKKPMSRSVLNPLDRQTDVITAKFAVSSEQCAVPSNMRTRSLTNEQARLGALPHDIIHLSASRATEVSFEDANKGGFATQYMRDCMLRDARDLDGSGAISMEEIAVCAQEKINERLRGVRDLTPHNIQLTGNKLFIPAWFSRLNPLDQQIISPEKTMPNLAQPSQQLTSSPAPTSAPTATLPATNLSGQIALKQIFDQRDAKRSVQVVADQDTLHIGQDYLGLTVQTDRAGYVYIAMAGSDNQSLYLLFPNTLDSDNKIQASQQLSLPRNSWKVKAAGPVGIDTILVVVTDTPRNLKQLEQMSKTSSAGPFLKSLNDSAGRAQLGIFATNSGMPLEGDCKQTSLTQACSDAFGAAILTVQEKAKP